jgi:hypothetical protein
MAMGSGLTPSMRLPRFTGSVPAAGHGLGVAS